MNDAVSALCRKLLRSLNAGAPPNVALMHLILRAQHAREAEQAIDAALHACATQHGRRASGRVYRVADLWRKHPGAWTAVRAASAEHSIRHGKADRALNYWSAAYDRLVNTSPEASVALYSLGSAELLKTATAEVITYLRCLGLLGPGRRVLELGCGIGRLIETLAPEVGLVIGVDISPEMVRHAERRCGRLANVSIEQSSGRDLNAFANASFDLVLAADVFPYICEAGPELVWSNLSEAARVLVPGGALVVLNFSYRGDAGADRTDLGRLADAIGLDVVQNGVRPFKFWDGLAFMLRKGWSRLRHRNRAADSIAKQSAR